MKDHGLFSPVVLGVLVCAVVAIFALSVALTTIGKGDQTPFNAGSLSPSAIGHKGVYALLERRNLPVVRSRLRQKETAGPGSLLVAAEPDVTLMKYERGSDLRMAPNLLLILPKYWGKRDVFHDGWLRRVALLGAGTPQLVLGLVDIKANVKRAPAPATWSRNAIGETPAFNGAVQLFTSSKVQPLIADGDKILLGEFKTARQRIWVLADPDPFENHGISTPANTRFVLAVVNALRADGGRIVFDETIHRAVEPERNPLKLLFKFPFVIVTIEILAALVLLLLAATGRFGGAEEAPAPFTMGKLRLIDNIAALMERAGHQASVLRRYLSVKVAEAGRALHAPPGLDEAALATWLDKIGRARGVEASASAILAGQAGSGVRPARRLFGAAQDIDRWSRNLLDGPSGRQDHG